PGVSGERSNGSGDMFPSEPARHLVRVNTRRAVGIIKERRDVARAWSGNPDVAQVRNYWWQTRSNSRGNRLAMPPYPIRRSCAKEFRVGSGRRVRVYLTTE